MLLFICRESILKNGLIWGNKRRGSAYEALYPGEDELVSIAAMEVASLGNLGAPEGPANAEYAELKARVKRAGLLEKQPGYYILMGALTLGLMAVSIVLASVLGIIWLHMANGAFMAIVFTHIGFLGHDAGHLQIFRTPKRNYLALLGVGLLIGLSPSWWMDKHNNHHANPNDVDLDMDINIPIIAFTEEQALAKRGLPRHIVKYQSILFFPMLLIEALSIRADSAQFIMRGKNVKHPLAESLAVILHFVLYFTMAFTLMSPMHALGFILVHQGLVGVYMGSVFAPNHKGMPVLSGAIKLDFLRRQVLTARNVGGNPAIDYMYGGLNYQIEHHLFPTVPRNKLASVRPIVQQFCKERNIPYYETGVVQSYREILGHLGQIGAQLRKSSGRASSASQGAS